MVAALTGWGHIVTAAESAADAQARMEAGGIDVAFVDNALVVADPLAWRAALAAHGKRAALILMAEVAEGEGVAPPFELSALKAALRGITKEYA